MRITTNRPSPALGVAMVALFVALGGTAGAVGSAAVPLAKRAFVADKAKVATTAKLATTATSAAKAKLATSATTAAVAQSAGLLSGQTSSLILANATAGAANAAVAQSPPGARPASAAAGVVQLASNVVTLGPGVEGYVTLFCSPHKVAMGGFQTTDAVIGADSHPLSNGSGWRIYLVNLDTGNPATVTVHATCIR